MSSQIKLIRFFIDHKDESFSINSIAKKLKINYRIVFEEIKKLEAEKIITIKKLGNSDQCSFNYFFNENILEAENQKKEEFLKNKTFRVLHKRIMEIKNPLFICLIFGSYAKGIQTKQSDIDLCAIADDVEIKKRIEQVLRLMPLEIHFLIFTTKEFISMLKTTDSNVGKEIVKNNIILKGTELFYELINHAR